MFRTYSQNLFFKIMNLLFTSIKTCNLSRRTGYIVVSPSAGCSCTMVTDFITIVNCNRACICRLCSKKNHITLSIGIRFKTVTKFSVNQITNTEQVMVCKHKVWIISIIFSVIIFTYITFFGISLISIGKSSSNVTS